MSTRRLGEYSETLLSVLLLVWLDIQLPVLSTVAAAVLLSDMSGPTAQYRVDTDGVAVITLTNPPVNALHPAGE